MSATSSTNRAARAVHEYCTRRFNVIEDPVFFPELPPPIPPPRPPSDIQDEMTIPESAAYPRSCSFEMIRTINRRRALVSNLQDEENEKEGVVHPRFWFEAISFEWGLFVSIACLLWVWRLVWWGRVGRSWAWLVLWLV